MNILSAISIMICTSFLIGMWHIIIAERKTILNLSASAVLLSLSWWSFCNTFFFVAITQEQAWFWHKLGSFGWCGFVAFTAYYFYEMTNDKKKKVKWWKRLLFFAPLLVLLCKNLFGKTTSLAQNVVHSTSGWGWTYQNSITSFWLWAYLLYVVVYFGFSFYLLYQWAKTTKHRMKKEMAIGFIILDAITILFGVLTDVILPLTNPVLPALASVGTALFGIGYFGIIYRYDIFNINLIISSDDILQTSNNSIFVMDENKEILKYNRAVADFLGYHKSELIGQDFISLIEGKINFHQLDSNPGLVNREVQMRAKDGTIKNVLLSASVAKDKHNSFLCMIVSCQDVSKQKKVQEELQKERKKYKKLADDYQRLAYYDPLTDLPNRRYFFDALSDFEKTYQTEKKDFAVLVLDLNRFKYVNDIYGHTVGDAVLKAAAKKLQACMENNELVARLGGDEFMMIMPCVTTDYVEYKMQRIQDEFQQNIVVDGKLHETRISAGYAIFSQVQNLTKVIQKADEAMYRDKNNWK